MATQSPTSTGKPSAEIAAAASLRSERGFTLVELLVTLIIFLGVLAVVVPALTAILRSEPQIRNRAHSVQTARTTVERIVRELRVGYRIDTATASQLRFRTYNRKQVCGGTTILAPDQPATQCIVTYTCSGPAGDVACTRSEQPTAGTGGSSARLVEGLESSSVFSYVPNASEPDHVRIRLVLPGTAGDDAITLEDGADLRNISPGA